jgi:hypothetical protein
MSFTEQLTKSTRFKMSLKNNNLGKFFGPSASYAGYVFIGCGIFASAYSLLALTLFIPGFFMAFTYNGTIIDMENKRIKPYTSLFGIYKTGEWINADRFTRFSIIRATKKYTSYSRANVRFDMAVSDIELIITNANCSKKIVLNKYSNLEDAHKEMEELQLLLLPDKKTN